MTDMSPLEYFICGGFGGVCTVLVGHPLDTIKVWIYSCKVSNYNLLFNHLKLCLSKFKSPFLGQVTNNACTKTERITNIF